MKEPATRPHENVSPPEIKPPSRRERLVLGVVLAAATVWRMIDCQVHVFSPDQLFSVRLATLPWGDMLAATTADVHPPLYYAILKLWFLAAPNTLTGAKILSVIFSLGTLLFIRQIARDLYGDVAAWIALLVAGFSPYAVYWSHTTRNHALLPLCVSGACLFGWGYLRAPNRRDWWLTAVFLGLAFQTNYLGLVFGALWCIAIIFEQSTPLTDRLRLCGAGAPGTILFAPWVSIMFEHTTRKEFNPGFLQETLSPIYLYYHSLFGGMIAYQPPQSGPLYLALLTVFAVICGFGIRIIASRPSLGVLLIALPTVPILMARYGSMTLAERHLLFSLPLFYAYFGGAVADLWRRLRGQVDHLIGAERRVLPPKNSSRA